jgi:hypothetical protein
MRITRTLLFLYLIIAATLANAQQFKVLKDTNDYKLMEVDSGYYYSHGVECKKDFILDTTVIKKKNGVLRLPLLNGNFKEFKDTLVLDTFNFERAVYEYKGENKKFKLYLIIAGLTEFLSYGLIDEKNGDADWIDRMPCFSPNNSYYGYCFFNPYSVPMSGGVFFKEHKTKKQVRINTENKSADNFKWINDYSFLYSSIVSGSYDNGDLMYKYFLVEIKKIK